MRELVLQFGYVNNLFYIFVIRFRHLQDPVATLDSMLRPTVTALPGHIQSVLVQNVLKLYTHILVQWEAEEPSEKSLRLLSLSKQRATAAALAKQNGSVTPEVRALSKNLIFSPQVLQ